MSLLSEQEINKLLKIHADWIYADKHIDKVFVLRDFKQALEFVNKVGLAAEEFDHHPDILMYNWNKVKISISTHSAGGVTMKDFHLAQIIDSIIKSI